MSIDDLIQTMFCQELYEFRIDDAEYYKAGDIPPDLLIRTVVSWESIANNHGPDSYCLEIYTWNYYQDQILSDLDKVCFNIEQISIMTKNGVSLSNITDMTLEIDSVKKLYSEQGFNKERVRPIVYEYYANKLIEQLNSFILGKEEL